MEGELILKSFGSRDPPAAMFDNDGNLLTTIEAIENRAIKVYTERMKPNEMKGHLKALEVTENKLCEERLKLSKLNKTDPWTLEDLNLAINDLDNNKS